ncbi:MULTISPECIES: AbrB/MazE/SpoVT family DNA-binding domain-containing protein [Listeria]|uniref:AbrB/MazE/SpoVT family DNA-binding domain-containing protein n=9 Tax=Listeria TaxID=1637 RepID=A0A099VYT1_9LIST|nr:MULTISPECIES: AbrB/MazE/SpoVT family DNA-binding domain-containing protein [Listeria]KGL42395.1 transition state regulator Abh [Listeriaceae bacterium FSL A5-0209]AQY52145.1 transition state regulator Abh [Listeria weihenstephanensis]EUJ21681.1 transition state regulatory protein [Listeria grandensis FSL F6-0971]EUJ25427.1 transition state regulatory protein [Listeria cornellensis FSL F6-0969]EUJ39430.1 transition state regulatory protein [Listeria weihenstephanensis FSL R9-0317]
MKSTGMVRKIDELGRIVIPVEIRRNLGVAVKDALEIYINEDEIILKKYTASNLCDITGEFSDQNKQVVDGKLTLSRDGAEKLVADIRRQFGDDI